ncbi:MAG: DUF3788 domain-containing protein [Terracidiphilus sp.]|jgi:hypothetical protein
MEIPNAFIGKKSLPTAEEIAAALGPAKEVWQQLIDWLAEQGVAEQEWKSVSAKYGWAVRLKLKKRTIVYLGPSVGCFRVSFVLGDRAVAAAREGSLSKSTHKVLEEAPRYPEGTGVRLIIKNAKDLVDIHKLAMIKLTN